MKGRRITSQQAEWKMEKLTGGGGKFNKQICSYEITKNRFFYLLVMDSCILHYLFRHVSSPTHVD